METPPRRRFGLVLSLVAACLLLSACGRWRDAQAAQSAAGTASHTLDGGRVVHVFAPDFTEPTSPALVIGLHGGMGNGLQFRENSGFDAVAAEHGFVVAYPDGTSIWGERDQRTWNAGACCGRGADAERAVDDVGFVSDVIDLAVAEYGVDPARVYVAGHSNGAMMAYRLACELSDRIAGVAVVAGSLEVGDCAPTHAVRVLHLHGLADANVRIDGGAGGGISDHVFHSPRLSVAELAHLNGCHGSDAHRDTTNPDVTVTLWAGCDVGADVALVTIDGAEHPWMGRSITRLQRRFAGQPYMDLDATTFIWDWFEADG